MDVVCPHCSSIRFPGETPGICCSSGKINLPPLPELPQLLKSLVTGQHPRSSHFMKNVKQYNCLYNFTSFGSQERNLTDSRGNRLWSPGFCIQGQCYHSIGPLFPDAGNQPSFLQIYFIDNEEQTRRRMSLFDGLNPEIIRSLSDMLQQTNPFVTEFQHAADTIRRSNLPGLRVSTTLNYVEYGFTFLLTQRIFYFPYISMAS